MKACSTNSPLIFFFAISLHQTNFRCQLICSKSYWGVCDNPKVWVDQPDWCSHIFRNQRVLYLRIRSNKNYFYLLEYHFHSVVIFSLCSINYPVKKLHYFNADLTIMLSCTVVCIYIQGTYKPNWMVFIPGIQGGIKSKVFRYTICPMSKWRCIKYKHLKLRVHDSQIFHSFFVPRNVYLFILNNESRVLNIRCMSISFRLCKYIMCYTMKRQ